MHAVSIFKSQTLGLKLHSKCGFACPCTVQNTMSRYIKQKLVDKHMLLVKHTNSVPKWCETICFSEH